MAFSMRSAGLIRTLLYPVLFESNPVDGVDRVLAMVMGNPTPGFKPEDYLGAIHEALACDDSLSELLPQDHTERDIRRFLSEVGRRIERA